MIDKNSTIHKRAKIGKNVKIGPYCVIEENVEINDNCELIASVHISGNTLIGKNNKFFPFCSIGSAPQDLKYKNEQTYLKIGDNNSFREYVTVSPGTAGGGNVTQIGNNNLFMVSSHIGHDCYLENNIVIANNAAIAGHCNFGDNVIIGGNSAVLQFSKIGKGSMIGGMTGVDKDILPFSLVKGNRCRFENINLIGLKRMNHQNNEINEYRETIDKLFKCENLENFKKQIDNSNSKLLKDLLLFLNNKNKNRDICRP